MQTRTLTVARLSACCLLAACGTTANAQYFQRHYGTDVSETPRGVNQTNNEDLVTTGFEQNAAGGAVAYVSRHRPDGALLWSRLYREVDNQANTGWSMLETFGGDLIVAGQTLGSGPLATLSMMRLSPLGAVVWVGSYESTSFQTSDVFVGVRRNVAVEELSDIGFAAVTTENGTLFPGLTRGQMVLVGQSGVPIFQKAYISNITFIPNGVSFNDLRVQSGPASAEIVVTGTLEFQPQGGPTTYEALYARFDLGGNPISAFSYRFQPAAGGPSFDIYGDGIQTLPGGDVIIMGRTNIFDNQAADTAVLRLSPGGAPGVDPRHLRRRSLCRRDEPLGLPRGGNCGVHRSDGARHRFDRAAQCRRSRKPHLQPRLLRALARAHLPRARSDLVSLGAPGWAATGDETDPHTVGMRDVDLLRTDTNGRTGCFERRVPGQVLEPFVQIRQLQLFQSTQEIHTFRQVVPTDPMWADKIVCLNDCPCPGDANGDGVIDFNDINAVIASWGAVYAPGSGPGDANCDGVVDFNDINLVIANWGSACP